MSHPVRLGFVVLVAKECLERDEPALVFEELGLGAIVARDVETTEAAIGAAEAVVQDRPHGNREPAVRPR